MTRLDDPLADLPLPHRLVLRLLPSHVREEHGRELRDDLLEHQPSLSAVTLDVLRAAPAAHWDVLRQDVSLALRQVRRAPAFALVAGLTLALGIGGNVAFFTLIDGVLLRELPLAGADRIVDITEENLGRNLRSFGISPANFRDVVSDSTLYQASAVYNGRSGTLRLGDDRQRVSYTAVSGDFFRVFTDTPVLGRTLRREDDVPGATAIVLAYDFWQGTLGGDAGVIGREIELDAERLRVVGIMPPNFQFPTTTTAFWRPIALSEHDWATRGARFVSGVARLARGVPVVRASSAAATTGRALATQYARTNTASATSATTMPRCNRRRRFETLARPVPSAAHRLRPRIGAVAAIPSRTVVNAARATA